MRFGKGTLPQLNRHVQCLHPGHGLSEAQREERRVEALRGQRHPLRRPARTPTSPAAPHGVTGSFELTTVHIAYSDPWIIPFVLRTETDGNTTTQLVASASHPHEVPIPFEELPRPLTSERGRMRRRDRARLTDFSTQALTLDCHTERPFLARAQTLRNKEV